MGGNELISVANPIGSQVELSPAETQRIEELIQQINLQDSMNIVNYGVAKQRKFKQAAEASLGMVLDCDLGAVSEVLAETMTTFQRLVDGTGVKTRGIMNRLGRTKKLQREYDAAGKTLEKLSNALTYNQLQLSANTKMMDKLHQQVLQDCRELRLWIIAGRQKLATIQGGRLKQLQQQANVSGVPEDALAYRDLAGKCNSFEQRLQDMELTLTACLQTAAQIELTRDANQHMVLKTHSCVHNVIPLWQQQLAIAQTKQYRETMLATSSTILLTDIGEVLSLQQTEQERRDAIRAELHKSEAAQSPATR